MKRIISYLDDCLSKIENYFNSTKKAKILQRKNRELEKEIANLNDCVNATVLELDKQKRINLRLRKELNSYKAVDKSA